jgi:hypothetical protein
MNHPNHPFFRVVGFKKIAPFTLRVVFDDRKELAIDFRPILAGNLFGPLADQSLFDQVRIDPEVHTLVWPNGADFGPATLHDWPEYVEGMTARAQEWEILTR